MLYEKWQPRPKGRQLGSGWSSAKPLLLQLIWSKLFCSKSCGYTEQGKKKSLDSKSLWGQDFTKAFSPSVQYWITMMMMAGELWRLKRERGRSIVKILSQNKAKEKAVRVKGKMNLKTRNTSSWFFFQELFLFPVDRNNSHLATKKKGSRSDVPLTGNTCILRNRLLDFWPLQSKHFLLTKCRNNFTFEPNTSLRQAQ